MLFKKKYTRNALLFITFLCEFFFQLLSEKYYKSETFIKNKVDASKHKQFLSKKTTTTTKHNKQVTM